MSGCQSKSFLPVAWHKGVWPSCSLPVDHATLQLISPAIFKTLYPRIDLPVSDSSGCLPGISREFQLLPATPLNYDFRLAKTFYIEYPEKPSILTKCARDSASNIPLLHLDYLNAVRNLRKESEFLDCACSCLKISTQPRLINDSQNLTPEFKFPKNNAAMDLLILLRHHWDMYYGHL